MSRRRGGLEAIPVGKPRSRGCDQHRATSAMLRAGAIALTARAKLRRRGKRAQQAELERERFYDRVWREAAVAVGAEVESLSRGFLEIRKDGATVRVRGHRSPADDQVTLDVAGDKPLVYRFLLARDVPVPRHEVFSLRTFERARAFRAEHGGPCVVKPAVNGSAGRSVTTGVLCDAQLLRAAMVAAGRNGDALIEHEIPGRNFRVLFFDDEVLDIVERRPPSVTGDGSSSVRTLVEAENARRRHLGVAGMMRGLSIDLDMRNTLARQGLGLTSTPRRGQPVVVKTAINDNAADENRAAGGILCNSIIEDARRATCAIGARITGVDVVTIDPSLSLSDAGGVVLEVNATPGLHFHHHRSGEGFPAATEILRRLFSAKESGQ